MHWINYDRPSLNLLRSIWDPAEAVDIRAIGLKGAITPFAYEPQTCIGNFSLDCRPALSHEPTDTFTVGWILHYTDESDTRWLERLSPGNRDGSFKTVRNNMNGSYVS
jgi:hypothetical protein